MRKRKVLSFLMMIVLLVGAVAPALVLPVFAADEEEEEEMLDYTKEVYLTPEDKLYTMGEPVYTNGDMELYYHPQTAEVMIRNAKTGQLLSTNPYNVGSATFADTQKVRLLSQLIIKYRDSSNTQTEFDSYTYAALNDQILMKKIRGGIRVEYAIGNSQKKRIVPRWIAQDRFESVIYEAIKESDEYTADQVKAWYQLKDPNDPNLTAKAKSTILTDYPITAKFPIYIIDPGIKARELTLLERYVLAYTTYTLEDMLADNDQTGYVLEDDSPPLFKMSLEYYLNEDGVTVNLPARGITYDMAKYKLQEVRILPFFGAGFENENGFTFIPDGSGAIIDFKDATAYSTVSGKIYGNDYGFYGLVGGNLRTWRLPVYGIVTERPVSEVKYTSEVELDDDGKPEIDPKTGKEIIKVTRELVSQSEPFKQGYFAVIEEGESLATLTAEQGGTLHNCNSCYITVYPRQSDSYPLDGITVSGQTATYEVDCERKYVGNFRTRYFMLGEDKADYVGMANVYRQYLIDQGVFSKETIHKDGDDLTLYLESIGDIDTTEKILGVPVSVKTALSTTEAVQTMTELLQGRVINQRAAEVVYRVFPGEFESEDDVTVEKAQTVLDNYILRKIDEPVKKLAVKYTGWYNGGMWHTPPSKLSVDGAIGGENGFRTLAEYAAKNGIDLYPDLDFNYAIKAELFDNFDYKTDTAKMVDGKPAIERIYNYVYQSVNQDGKVVLSSVIFEKFFDAIKDKFASLNSGGVSLASLGGGLNSSQDENDPVNREEAKGLTVELLSKFKEAGNKILVNSGNFYTLKYADAVLDAPLDSNNRVLASHEIPFYGMVLHGYVDFTGEAINLAGDFDYTVLKTIENGASPYFMLSLDNVSKLKTAGYSEFFAVEFDIWFDEVLSSYREINKALKAVAGSVITSHEFVADRVVKVGYSNGVSFIINYNNFKVTADGTELAAMSFKRV